MNCCFQMCQTNRIYVMEKGRLLLFALLSSCNEYLCHSSKYSPSILKLTTAFMLLLVTCEIVSLLSPYQPLDTCIHAKQKCWHKVQDGENCDRSENATSSLFVPEELKLQDLQGMHWLIWEAGYCLLLQKNPKLLCFQGVTKGCIIHL